MKYKVLLIILFIVVVFSGCKESTNTFAIKVAIDGMPQQTVILEQLSANDIISIVDSVKSNQDGSFIITGSAPEAGLYRLHFTDNRYILLTVDKGTIIVRSSWTDFENYTLQGSHSSSSLRTFIFNLRQRIKDLNSIGIVIDTMTVRGQDSLLTIAKAERESIEAEFTKYIEHYADTTLFEPNAVFAARMLNAAQEFNYLEHFNLGLKKRFANTQMTKDYQMYFEKVERKIQEVPKEQAKVALNIGDNAPEISVMDKNGKPITLSSLKGKYVFISFWASWNVSSRNEHKDLVNLYKKNKAGHVVFLSISLDTKKEDWLAAIEKDNLTWPLQGCDMQGLSSPIAAAYGVGNIPYNFVISPQGVIMEKDLHGPILEQMIDRIVK